MRMSKRFIITIATIIVVAIAAYVAIFFAKGYTFSPTEKKFVGTGIINISSEPDAASVYIDGHLTTATNATVPSLKPKEYSVRVVKEGFIPWEKQIEVKEGLVTAVKVTLFPSIPTIYPLTFSGVANPTLSPDGSRLAYIVLSGKKSGVWVWTMARNEPIAFARSSEPHQIANSQFIDFSKANLRFSPDSKQVLATIGGQNWLLNADSLNSDPRDITPILDATLKSWEEDEEEKEVVRTAAIKNINFKKIASDSARLVFDPTLSRFATGDESKRANLSWSPDETKFMTDSNVYDLEENKEYQIPAAKAHMWLPDSRHIIEVSEGTISILDFDGTNKAVIFAGTFLDNFVFPWPDSSRLVIISSFPTPTASEPNLYGINLR